jgi:hypothetical protein
MMNKSQPRPGEKNPLLLMLVRRSVIFFALMGFFSVFLYGLGTRQGFTDAAQFLLIRLSSIFGILLFCAALCGFLLNFVFFLHFRFRFISRFRPPPGPVYTVPGGGHFYFFRNLWFYTGMMIAGFAAALFMAFILAISAGNAPI